MKEESDINQFFNILCKNSINKRRELAIKEWEFICSFIERKKHCICGKRIVENCIIQNKHNLKTLIVGNICVKKFLNKDCSFIFKGIASIKKNKIPNKEFIIYCYEKGYLYENQRDFLLNRYRKKNYTEAQKTFKDKILFKLNKKEKW